MTVLLKPPSRIDDSRALEALLSRPPEPGCVLSLPGIPWSGSTIRDVSPYGYFGTITGAAWVRLPSGLWVLEFSDSPHEVACGSVVASGPWSVFYWAYATIQTAAIHYPFSMSGSYGVYFGGTTQPNQWGIYTGGAGSDANTAVVTGQWYHFGITNNGSTGYTFYLYGRPDGVAATPYRALSDLTFGRRADHIWIYKGYLGRMRAYNVEVPANVPFDIFTQEKSLFEVW